MIYERKRFFSTLFIVICSFLIVNACNNVLDLPEHKPEAGRAAVHIMIGNGNSGARTILPSQMDNADSFYYHLELTHNINNGRTFTFDLNPETGSSRSVDLEIGEWTLRAWGFVSNPGASPVKANALVTAVETIEVKPGVVNTVNVSLSLDSTKLTQTDKGTFSYNISLPTNATGTIKVYGMDNLVQNDAAAFEAALNAGPNTGSKEELDSGFYYIRVNVVSGGRGASWLELAHIYDGAITIAEKSFPGR